jgi:hypothetical protein
MKRSIDWRRMLTPSASRKAPLKKAPSNRARCHPNERSCGESGRSDICLSSQQHTRPIY